MSPTMELLRSVIGGGGSSSSGATNGSAGSAAETIERLVSRMSSSTLLEDRRDACRALKAMSRKFRVEVGAQVLFVLLNYKILSVHAEVRTGFIFVITFCVQMI